jgi:predicted DCC family thiol-disulfide oxidoreductase YuxK
MSDAPEPTLSPNETASAPAEGTGKSILNNPPEAGWPQAPLLIFDGECGFCRRWITRWRSMTGDLIDYAPYQEVGEQFPKISQQEFVNAVQLVDTDGQIFSGAEAVFRALAQVPGKGRSLWCYRHVPGFAPVSRAVYRFVAGHRYGLSTLTRWFWGRGDGR